MESPVHMSIELKSPDKKSMLYLEHPSFHYQIPLEMNEAAHVLSIPSIMIKKKHICTTLSYEFTKGFVDITFVRKEDDFIHLVVRNAFGRWKGDLKMAIGSPYPKIAKRVLCATP